jgi:hypothetical protein
MLKNRGVFVCEGYFEWESHSGERKQPYFFRRSDHKLMYLASLFDFPHSGNPEEDAFRYCVITVEAAKSFYWIHNRMPAVIEEENLEEWLNPETPIDKAISLLKTCNTLEFYPVTRKVGYYKYDQPDCMLPEENTKPASKQSTLTNWIKQDNSPSKKPKVELKEEQTSEDQYWQDALPILEHQLAYLENVVSFKQEDIPDSEPQSSFHCKYE